MAPPSLETLLRAMLSITGAAMLACRGHGDTPPAHRARDGAAPPRRRAGRRRAATISGGTLALALVIGSLASGPAYANLESSIQAGSAVALAPGHELYFYLAATSGEQPIEALSWLEDQDLAVNAAASDEQALSIGHGPLPDGSYLSGALGQTTAAVAIDGYAITQEYAAQTHRRAHLSGHPGRRVDAAALTLRFRTSEEDQLVLILIGAQGAGSPQLGGIKANPLQDATCGRQGSEQIAAGAIYAVHLRPGKHKARLSTTSYIPNHGSALGAVVYVLTPLQPS